MNEMRVKGWNGVSSVRPEDKFRNWELQRGGEKEEEETKFPAQLQPHAQHKQEVGKPAENTQRESCDQQIGPSLENSLRRDQSLIGTGFHSRSSLHSSSHFGSSLALSSGSQPVCIAPLLAAPALSQQLLP
ncbi:hypothetical protein CapIbe_018095 [Capra ibex]